MKINDRSISRIFFRCFKTVACAVAFCFLATSAFADVLNLGALSYDTFIPPGNGSPGIYTFDLANLTGAYNLPPDFPVADNLTFQGAVLTLTLEDLSQQVFDLGDVAPGFLVDGSGNPIVQVPGDEVFDSAEFTATLSEQTIGLYDGTSFVADSTALDVLLLPSSGPTLMVDVDQTTIGVSGTVQSTPEPASREMVLLALPFLAWNLRRKRILDLKLWRRR
jgi:hypothetical protein